MNILIAYAGKTGTTEKCAKILEEKLENVTISDLVCETPDINGYDIVIVGGSIRIGMIHPKAKQFINNNKEILLNKKVAYYICCGFSGECEKYFKENIDNELLDRSVIYNTFGGEMDMEKQKGMEKLIVKLVNKTTKDKEEKIEILHDNINNFIDKIKNVK